ncbi:aminodeoxychorismate synthase component I [Alicyclobacillus mali]|uniref:Aminodeoxychorismate synthase component I n=1 Tax=Alicyclobacillus mali (ex Roth et al. 2021) TaxID=1123961 RepID=A0ABS0EZ20_9BACL|nr:aminodeoxychorismate synthase component I [Alicyclobacillus mali (ex Roth et al. 2021)]MBF8376329.1 aminodeoxychorismate synthase component I [Alicyclobacillus mali (ex Roth et al. 2021)]MCL6488827.1 aminodeoxychorismate synthase component I [Alicyclobacillus mali (ex Roth et al. 2021)]
MAEPVRLVYDFAWDGERPKRLVFESPRQVWSVTDVGDVVAAMEAAADCAKNGAWVCGFVTYEAAPAFQSHLPVRRPWAGLPLAWFAAFDEPRVGAKCEWDEQLNPALMIAEQTGAPDGRGISPMWWSGLSRPYRATVEAIRQSIARGEVYQVNVTGRSQFRGLLVSELAYEDLRRSQRAKYAAWLRLESWDIVSVSPELFYQRCGKAIVTRPMKGTSPRGRAETEDAVHRVNLERSEKERAENLMIVDLLRNDLGQIAEPGSVKVEKLFDIEAYPTVWQMTSTITATLRDEIDTVDIFRALFPCGSVTGAPKAAAMEAIVKAETSPRGVYCGAIGLWTPDHQELWSVAIRTLLGRRDRATWVYGTGSGVTWDSVPQREEAEVILKAAVLRRAGVASFLELLETMRLHEGAWFLYQEHRARVLASARTFGIPLCPEALDQALSACAASHSEGTWRVRVRVTLSGDVVCETAPFDGSGFVATIREAIRQGDRRALAISPQAVDRRWIWLYHKTTDREFYERIRSGAPGAWDVLLYNEDGELTEGTFGNIAYELENVWYTPPVECGLLPGTLRSRLIRDGELRERALHLNEIDRVTRWCWLNGLRGVTEVLVDGMPARDGQASDWAVNRGARIEGRGSRD